MTPTQSPFQLGDRVIHAAKPDWGIGHVLSAKPDPENGPDSQKLQIRFQHSGMKTLSTTYATLRPVSENGEFTQEKTPSTPPSSNGDATPKSLAQNADPTKVMCALPSEATDPFATPPQRLEATLELFKYTEQAGSLIEWATLQSGLADPLSRFSRHDLEEFFSRYAIHRDRHLSKVSQENLRTDPKALALIVSKAPPGAKEALRRINRRS